MELVEDDHQIGGLSAQTGTVIHDLCGHFARGVVEQDHGALRRRVSHTIAAVNDDAVEIPIEAVLDLHAFRPDEVRSVALEYLAEARRRGLREVRLIHGRGVGVQRANVQSLLSALDFVERFWDESSLGATVVVLSPAS
ncbi:MAG: hypothetical protein DMF57_03020 [Acidobacteria bacterium]|nr:MAG: hypothetical protein DMF57_03020 [Acidobacteriota bacterium]